MVNWDAKVLRIASAIVGATAFFAYASSGTSYASQKSQVAMFKQMTSLLGQMNSQANQLNNFNQLFLQSCMKTKGFVFYPDIVNSAVGLGNGPMPQGSELTAVGAATEGYGLYAYFEKYASQPRNKPQASTPESRYTATLTKKQLAAYNLAENGPPDDRFNFNVPGFGEFNAPKTGCQAKADKESFGSVQNSALIPNAPALVYSQWNSKISEDARVATLDATWVNCMSKAGFSFKSPNAAYDVLQSDYEKYGPTSVLHDKELNTAKQDVVCESEANWKSKLKAVEGSDAASVIETESKFILSNQQRNQKLLLKLSRMKN